MITNRPTSVGNIGLYTSSASNILLFTYIKLYRNKGMDWVENKSVRIIQNNKETKQIKIIIYRNLPWKVLKIYENKKI